MNIICTRTSSFLDNVKPCDEAKQVPFIRIDRRNYKTPKEIPWGDDAQTWYTIGFNHRIENGGLARDFRETKWAISINSLDELQAFCLKHGPLVLETGSDSLVPYLSVEIYDNYRE